MPDEPSFRSATGRAAHARRTADSHAAFFLPHLRPGMALLDLGCGPGTITVGLAARVAPGLTTGIDRRPHLPADAYGVTLVSGDVNELPFPDGSFDAIFASALLQHLPDPLRALREARRVARTGAVIGVVDADWDGQLQHPTNPTLERSLRLAAQWRVGTSPYVGRRLRALLTEAGFSRCEASARTVDFGTSAGVGAIADDISTLFDSTLARQNAAPGELDAFRRAWAEWGRGPGAFLARFWCEAIGHVD